MARGDQTAKTPRTPREKEKLCARFSGRNREVNENPLLVFALSPEAPALRILQDTLREAGFPVSFGTDIAGEALEDALDDPDWEAAFLRWNEPEMHEVALLERMDCREDEEGLRLVSEAMNRILESEDEAGRLIVASHLQLTTTIYALQLLDALFTDEDHPAWVAFDVLLRAIAEKTEGLIYAENEGFMDADGELLLDETGEEGEEEESEGE
jgi:hypothetical protein